MRIRITKTSDVLYWYSNYIGRVFNVKFLDERAGEFVVNTPEGYVNIIKQADCEVVKDYD